MEQFTFPIFLFYILMKHLFFQKERIKKQFLINLNNIFNFWSISQSSEILSGLTLLKIKTKHVLDRMMMSSFSVWECFLLGKVETSIIYSLGLINIYGVNLINRLCTAESIEYVKKHPEKVKKEIIKNTVIKVININIVCISTIKEFSFIWKSTSHAEWEWILAIFIDKILY